VRAFEAGEIVMVGVVEQVLEHNSEHASQVGVDEYVLYRGLIPKVNHSCDPNCGIQLNESGSHDYVARRFIGPGDEITFDYAMRNLTVEHFPARCRCGERACRGRITGWQDLPESRRRDYEGFVAPYLLELDRCRKEG
jgi:uncharacterized protein